MYKQLQRKLCTSVYVTELCNGKKKKDFRKTLPTIAHEDKLFKKRQFFLLWNAFIYLHNYFFLVSTYEPVYLDQPGVFLWARFNIGGSRGSIAAHNDDPHVQANIVQKMKWQKVK